MASRRVAAEVATEKIWHRACDPELAEVCASIDGVLALQRGSVRALNLLRDASSTARELLDGICSLCLLCLELAEEAGLCASALLAELLCLSLEAAALLFAAEDEETSPDDRGVDRLKHQHRGAIAKFLEPLGEALDSLVVDIVQGLKRLEEVLQPDWRFAGPGQGAHILLRGISDANDLRLYHALTGLCTWALELVARGVGFANFSAGVLWEFASEDVLSAVVFVKGALCFQQGIWELQGVPIPEDLPELRDAVLGAVLSLCSQDIAFSGCDDAEDESIDIAARNEQLILHRATIAAAAVECNLLECLLAYPWLTGLMGAERLPSLVSFLRETSDASQIPAWSPFLITLAEKVHLWGQQLVTRNAELWNVLAPLATTKRGFLRDCAALACIAPPSSACCLELLQKCLSDSSSGGVEAALADLPALAALVAFAANSRAEPGNDVLTGVLVHLDADLRARLAAMLKAWPWGPLSAETLQPWLDVLCTSPDDVSAIEEEEPRPPALQVNFASCSTPNGLRELVADAPDDFCCALDGRLLVDPVRTPAGLVFERSMLLRALQASGGHCPKTGSPLALEDCWRDTELRKQIVAWVRQSRPRVRT